MVKVEAYEVPEGLYYSKDFEWVKIEGDKIRMGITDYAQKSLREIVYAELPSVGTEVKQGEPYGTLESVKAVSDLIAALSGTCLLYTSDAADDLTRVDLGGRRLINK